MRAVSTQSSKQKYDGIRINICGYTGDLRPDLREIPGPIDALPSIFRVAVAGFFHPVRYDARCGNRPEGSGEGDAAADGEIGCGGGGSCGRKER